MSGQALQHAVTEETDETDVQDIESVQPVGAPPPARFRDEELYLDELLARYPGSKILRVAGTEKSFVSKAASRR